LPHIDVDARANTAELEVVQWALGLRRAGKDREEDAAHQDNQFPNGEDL
jgi:hypothetical protein